MVETGKSYCLCLYPLPPVDSEKNDVRSGCVPLKRVQYLHSNE